MRNFQRIGTMALSACLCTALLAGCGEDSANAPLPPNVRVDTLTFGMPDSSQIRLPDSTLLQLPPDSPDASEPTGEATEDFYFDVPAPHAFPPEDLPDPSSSYPLIDHLPITLHSIGYSDIIATFSADMTLTATLTDWDYSNGIDGKVSEYRCYFRDFDPRSGGIAFMTLDKVEDLTYPLLDTWDDEGNHITAGTCPKFYRNARYALLAPDTPIADLPEALLYEWPGHGLDPVPDHLSCWMFTSLEDGFALYSDFVS